MKVYEQVVQEIVSGIHKTDLKHALKLDKASDRVGTLQCLIRDSIGRSTLGVFNGRIYYFSGCIYEELPYECFGDMMYEVLLRCGISMGDIIRVESIIKVCSRKVATKRLQIDKTKVVFANCVVDTRTRQVYEFSPEHVQFVQLPYDYDAKARCVEWTRFLNRVLPSKVYQKVLQEFLGSLFVSRSSVKMETMMVLYGHGSNGKSVVFNTVVGLLGKESVSNFGLDELIGKGQERKRNIASINGKRLNYASETRGMTIASDSGTLKALISGEPIEARAMYGDNFVVDEIPHIMINTNVLPSIDDWTHGMRRRICIIPFTQEISKEEQNKELSNDLQEEYPAIFNWILDGRDSFARNGYKLSESLELEDFMEDYEHSFNNVTRFMKETGFLPKFKEMKDAQPQWVKVATLYKKYKDWVAVNFEILEGVRSFSQRLKESGYNYRRTSDGVVYAIYGRDALNKLLNDTRQKKISLHREQFYAKIKKNKHVKAKEREKFEELFQSKVACGDTELAQYLNVELSTIADYDKRGKLAGTYQQYGVYKMYSLNLIDKYVLPDMDERLMLPIEKKRIRRKEELRAEDYEKNDIV